MTPIEQLRSQFPWPETRPEIPASDHGYFSSQHERELSPFCGPDVKCVLEIGSWCGKSARWFCGKCPSATVICCDTWAGSVEHWVIARQMLPKLYETFLSSCWGFRDRIIPVRTNSIDGMFVVRSLEIAPDLIYIDGAHDERSVYEDVISAISFFPEAKIVGDDWDFGTVQSGVKSAVADSRNRLCIGHEIDHGKQIWRLEKV